MFLGIGLRIGGGGSAGAGGIGVSSVVLNSVTYTAGGSGVPDSLELVTTGDTTGYRVYIATGTNPITVTAQQLLDGAGGTNTIEFADFAMGTNIDVTGLTAASNGANRIAVCLINGAGTLATNIVTATVSGLDFTLPALSSGTTNSAGSTVTLTMSESLFGTATAANWTVKRNGSGQTPSTISIVGSTVTLGLGTSVTSGQTVTVSYSGGDLEDGKGNALATITDAAVTNAVPNASLGTHAVFDQAGNIISTGTPTSTFSGVFDSAGDWLVTVFSANDNTGNPTFSFSGTAVTGVTTLNSTLVFKTSRLSLYQLWVTTSGASNFVITETGGLFNSNNRRVVRQRATNLTPTGVIAVAGGTASNVTTFNLVSPSSVPAGHIISAAAFEKSNTVLSFTWGTDLSESNELYDSVGITATVRCAGAQKTQATSGVVTAQVVMGVAGSHGIGAMIALAPV